MLTKLGAVLIAIAAQAGHQDHAHDHGAVDDPDLARANIRVTINPEARVSAVARRPLPASRCGAPLALAIHIRNEGFVTAPLRAILVGDHAAPVGLHLDPQRLSGRATELRLLHLEPLGPTPVDVTIAFSISEEVGDLGGRDRVHLYLACREPAPRT